MAQVWGRAAPNGLPAENTARSIRSRKTRPRRAADSVPPSLRSPSGSPQRNAQARSEPRKPDNHIDDSRTRYRRSRPTAEQERNISQAVLFGAHAANSRRDRTQDLPTGTYDSANRSHAPQQEHRTGIAAHKPPPDPPRPADQPPARTIPSAGAATGQTQPFDGAQFTIL